MNKEPIILILFCLSVLIITFYLPWYLTPLIGFVYGYLSGSNWTRKALIAFIFPFVVWSVISVVRDQEFDIKISNALGQLFNGLPSWIMYVITGIIVSIPTTLASISGHLLRKQNQN